MRLDIITVLPQLLEGPLNHSIIKRAQEKGIIKLYIHNLRDYSRYSHRQVDDYVYGGGAGMLLMVEPIADCIEKLKSERKYDEIIYMSPDGELLDQKMANQYSMKENMILLCGHYKGVDERVRQHFVTKEISIGNYVLSGGELPACIFADTIIRLIPGVLNDESSALTDSFQDDLISPPLYTRPADFRGFKVPDILLSGNTPKVQEWNHEQSLKRTGERRKNLLK